MVTEFFAWWWRQIRSMLPVSLAGSRSDGLIIAIDHLAADPAASRGAVLLRRGGRETPAAILDFSRPVTPASSMPASLRLPAGQILCREIILPAAAARDAKAVLGFEMDRFTPFTADEVFWNISGPRRDADTGTMRVTLMIAVRRPVEALLAALATCNLRPEFLECEGGRIALSSRAGWRGRKLQTGLYALCAILALACIIAPFLRQQIELGRAQTQISALQPAGAQAARLRQRIGIAASDQAAMTLARADGDAMHDLAALTDALPDGTWLTGLTLKDDDLTIDGDSSNGSRLLALLSATPGFYAPRLAAPVTRAANGNVDLFSIEVTVKQ